MCGRFTLRTPSAQLARHFHLPEISGFDPPLEPRFNIAPSQKVVAIRAAGGGGREMVMLRWGLVPSWAEDPGIGNRLINARADSVHQKPSFRTAFRRRRCLVAADGFYEWQSTAGQKQPYHFSLGNQRVFGFAGLWEAWERNGQAIESCTLITTEANETVAPVHNRMPVILAETDYDTWLDPGIQDSEKLLPLLCPFHAEPLIATPVGRWVNAPAHEGPRCIEPDST